ncbi:MAG: response regulator transcription factor, partial [Leptolyngbya sp. SIO4C1]|nr:response regulator transcription factor [Leptolyngbya sp. SIO4C1]
PVTVTAEVLQPAVAAVTHGLSLLHPTLAAPPGSWGEGFESREPLSEPLTPREIEVLGELALGLSNKAIAQRLMISEHTVKFHISALLGKLGAASRTEAVAVGLRQGLIML